MTKTMKEKFSLQHTVLYAKGWYKKYNAKSERKTIWDDLVRTLEMDGYEGTFIGDSPEQIKQRVTSILVRQFERLPYKGSLNSLATFFDAVRPQNCWRYGYYTKDYYLMHFRKNTTALSDYDYDEAVAHYCLSYFCNINKDEWTPCAPDYSKMPRKNGINNKKLKKQFGELTVFES